MILTNIDIDKKTLKGVLTNIKVTYECNLNFLNNKIGMLLKMVGFYNAIIIILGMISNMNYQARLFRFFLFNKCIFILIFRTLNYT